MKELSRSIVIAAPLRNVYNQWTQFEAFPRFLSSRYTVRQLDRTRVVWHARIWGRRFKWRTDICEQVPDRYIAWRGNACGGHQGIVTFEAIDGDTTQVTVRVDYHPRGFVAVSLAALGVVQHRLNAGLLRFKTFVEPRAYITGGWRGLIRDGVVQPVVEAGSQAA